VDRRRRVLRGGAALDRRQRAGGRLLDLDELLRYNLSVDVGPLSGPGRSGSSDSLEKLDFNGPMIGIAFNG
jgi:hypothetical protein